MALKIYTPGIEQYAPGGSARLRILILGQGGVGKSRWSSYSPKPIFAACEPGVAAIADRGVPVADINTSVDMLDLLQFLKMECRQPDHLRKYGSLCIDTIDAYARKLKQEWCDANRKDVFTGREAWAFLEQKLNVLLIRLMSLDMNVIVLAHYKDKIIKDDDNDRETRELMIRLQGQTAETIFDDFDLVGHMESSWIAREGQRVEQRTLTFKRSPLLPMLKDRMNITPASLPVNFAPTDWTSLFSRLEERIAQLKPTEVVGEIPSAQPDVPTKVIAPAEAQAGPVPPQPPARIDLGKLDKPALQKLCRERGVVMMPDGTPIRANTIKAELVLALESTPATPAVPAPAVPAPAVVAPAVVAEPSAERPSISELNAQVEERLAAPVDLPAPAEAPVADVPEGVVNEATGELVQSNSPEVVAERIHDEAVAVVAEKLGGRPIALEGTPDPATAPAAALARAQAAAVAPPAPVSTPSTGQPNRDVCDTCGKNIGTNTTDNPDLVRLAWIRERRALCNADFTALMESRKKG